MRYPTAQILAVAILLALGTPIASAGTYTVYSCKTPAGAPSGVISEGGGGWMIAVKRGYNAPADNTCLQQSGAITAALEAWYPRPAWDRVEWRFFAPPSTRISSYSLVWSGEVAPFAPGGSGGDAFIIRESLADPNYRVRHYIVPGPWIDEVIDETNLDEASLDVGIACSGSGDCGSAPAGRFAISRSVVTLRDTSPPSGAVSGQAIDDGTWLGAEPFAYQAADAGAGVYRVLTLVDGKVEVGQIAGGNGGHCADATPGDGDAYVFNSPRPCQPAASGTAAVDVAGLPSGVHAVSIVFEDAAGNATTVYGPARKWIVNPARPIGPGSDLAERGAANGENPSDAARLSARWTRTRRSTLTGPYGRRQVIRGRLSDRDGAGIRGARIELITEIDGRRGAALDKGGARTRGDGRFTLILPRNVSSRTLLLRYRSHVNDTVAIAERALRLKVRAAVKLAVSPHTAGRGRSVRLSGRLIGRPLPSHGKVVELQARSPGERWITFRTIRASRRGRFATRYRFRRGGPVVYLMRARVRAADDYPYATGASHAARVRVR
jgi:hypothetical protein